MTQQTQYQAAMQRALELALLGPVHGPNPQVGAVILDRNHQVIAEGWHRGAGTPHAEVVALSQLAVIPDGCTAVITLEPCNHTGRTGPCAQALIDAGISRVVYASSDPGRESAGGAQRLREAGVEVIANFDAAAADRQLNVWLTAMRNQRPFVTLKWAASLDGRAAAEDGTSQWISGPESRAHAHGLRSQVDAILVGTATASVDRATLTARQADGTLYPHQPLRVVLGERGLPSDLPVFNGDAPSLQLKTRDPHTALAELWKREVRHLLIEGGPQVASAFVQAGLVDQFLLYQAPMLLGGPRVAVADLGIHNISQAKSLKFESVQHLGADLLITAVPTPPESEH